MKVWTNLEENQKLLELIDDSMKNGNTINNGCERFCSMFPSYTIDQARSRYYQLINSNKKMLEQTIVKPWDLKEEEELLKYFDEQIALGKTKTKIFGELAEKLDRSFNSVAGRYYILTNDNKIKEKHKVKEINIEEFVNSLASLDIKAIQKVLNDMGKLKKDLEENDQSLYIQNLVLENQALKEENNELNEVIEKQNKEIKKLSQINESIKTKFENLKTSINNSEND